MLNLSAGELPETLSDIIRYGLPLSNASTRAEYNSIRSASPHQSKYSSTSICPLPSSSIVSTASFNSITDKIIPRLEVKFANSSGMR